VAASADRIRQFVAHHAEGADIVMLVAGLGGGTGSAMSELVRVLGSLALPMVALVTLPGEHESAIAKVNAVRAVSDLTKVPGVTLILVDNSRLAEQHASAALDEYFQRINSMIVEPLDALNRINHRQGSSSIRSLDGENIRTLLTSSGVLNYAESRVSGLSVAGIMEWATGALSSSGLMPAGFVVPDITYLGFVVEASGSRRAAWRPRPMPHRWVIAAPSADAQKRRLTRRPRRHAAHTGPALAQRGSETLLPSGRHAYAGHDGWAAIVNPLECAAWRGR